MSPSSSEDSPEDDPEGATAAAARVAEDGDNGASSVVTVLHYRPIALGGARLPAYLQVRGGEGG